MNRQSYAFLAVFKLCLVCVFLLSLTLFIYFLTGSYLVLLVPMPVALIFGTFYIRRTMKRAPPIGSEAPLPPATSIFLFAGAAIFGIGPLVKIKDCIIGKEPLILLLPLSIPLFVAIVMFRNGLRVVRGSRAKETRDA